MDELRNAIVEEALTWKRTPYHDGVGIKGVGTDCAYLPLRIYQKVGLLPLDIVVPHYSPQAWLKKNHEDTTYISYVLKYFREITEAEVQPGDLVLYKVAWSWTHGGIVIDYPNYVLHPLKVLGVIGSHATNEGFLKNRARRYFTVI